MSKVDFILCTASIGLIGMTFYQMNRAQSNASEKSAKAAVKSADVLTSNVANKDVNNKAVVQKAPVTNITNITKPAVASQTGELYFGPVAFKDRKTAEAYLRQFQPEGDIEHVVEPEEDGSK
ncbi:uncharacterized protein LOC141855280 [Brevipalpus obovatus]|uniref:uncharacterized protein LOC141855280 n=1 Tax=Brevipalpus obovatus TaxID=246614 RepID=UPI003D9FAAB0